MKLFKFFLFLILIYSPLNAEENLKYFINKAIENNLKLNAERKNLEATKQNKNILRSEFLPSVTISSEQTSTTSTNRTDQSGTGLNDSNSDTESKTISLEQKLFSGFKGINTFKKSELLTHKARLKLKQAEQQTIIETTFAYFDLIYKIKNEKFNTANVNLVERQVESDNARLQKGEITLTDLAQSESSLAGANANLIKAKTELLSSKTNFQRVIRVEIPNTENLNNNIFIDLPDTLKESLDLAKLNNLSLLISKLEYEIAIKNFNIEKARLSPTASLKVSKSENKDFSSAIDKKDDESVKATITWPIIKGGENISSIKKSSFDKERAKLLLEDTQNNIITETSNSWSEFQSSKSVLEATRAQLKAAEIANEGITLEYDSGNSRTTLDVIQSRSLLLDARIAFAKAERDFVVSQFELAKQIGSLSPKLVK
tara:strand:- start:127 stop:1416 length:1290 start_codon:yes stop_codon:yes gene_type:complete